MQLLKYDLRANQQKARNFLQHQQPTTPKESGRQPGEKRMHPGSKPTE